MSATSSSLGQDRSELAHPTLSGADKAAVATHPHRMAKLLVLAIVGLAGVIALVVAASRVLGTLSKEQNGQMLTHIAEQGQLLVTITEDGQLESAQSKEMKCEVAGGSTILWIIEDGTEVNEGDELVRLDSSKIDEEISKQKIAYEKALAARVTAESELSLAKAAKREYLEGTFVQERQTIEGELFVAEENLNRAKEYYEYSKRLASKGYVNDLQLEADRFAVEKSQKELDVANTKLKVLDEFTKAKMLQELQSKFDAAVGTVRSEIASLELEEAHLKRLESQKEKCVIRAAADGMAIYSRGDRWWNQEPAVAEGTEVRENQTLIELPDLSQMQVKVSVHESKVEQVKRGMPARVRIQDREFTGKVTTIANQAAQAGWWANNVKKFETIVKIQGDPGLKPGMSAEVEILIARRENVLTLPVAAVVEQGGEFSCWVKTPEKVERRPLVVGPSNDQFIVVEDGVIAGDEVVLNPRGTIEEAREAALKPKEEDDPFGDLPSEDAPAIDATSQPKTDAQEEVVGAESVE